MDSSNAEKASGRLLCDVCGKTFAEGADIRVIPGIGYMHPGCEAPVPFSWGVDRWGSEGDSKHFAAGRASRDAEVAELREQLAAAEAALAKGREWLDADVLHSHDQWADLFTARPVVLEDRDREVAARALEDAAHFADRMYAGSDGTDADRAWIGGVTAVAINLRRLATEVRKGDA